MKHPRLARATVSGAYSDEELSIPAHELGHVVGVAVGLHPDGKLGVILLLHPPHPVGRPQGFELGLALTETDLEEIAECTGDVHRANLS